MEVDFEIKYHPLVIKEDLPAISVENKKRIKLRIEQKLMTHPETFGVPLRRSLKGYRKLRVGDYRVVFKLWKSIVFVLAIKHRSCVYKLLNKRI